MKKTSIILFIILCALKLSAQSTNISKNAWQMWLDIDAKWENDELHMPPYELEKIKSNAPSCGWDALMHQNDAYNITLPATVEEHAWNRNGNTYGICGDYTGVSWFTTELEIPNLENNKRIVLNFESARMRAEVYLNRQLVGYEMINGTPFSVDISDFAKKGQKNELAVRITDPNGNYAWRDWDAFMWGKYETMPSHGFGGITGGVELEITDKSFIEDVFIKNNPQANKVSTEISLKNLQGVKNGNLTISINKKGSKKTLWTKKVAVKDLKEQSTIKNDITIKNAKLWSPDSPTLYTLNIAWKSTNGEKSQLSENFGFRWFDVKEVKGDKMFFLNGKRIILHTAISWGHWPVNGIYPTPELARKHITAAKELGMNMLNFHRGISQPCILDLADELGLLIYEEPGGYKPGTSDFILKWKREKLLRMVKRDRNHPSLVIYNMINESSRNPFENEIQDMKDAHKLDPTRAITFTSTMFPKKLNNGICPITPHPVKSHMLPNNHEVLEQGWWDKHHAGGPGVYQDEHYKSPSNFLRYKKEKDEIIFYGEEGAIGTPHRLQLIKEEIEKTGKLGYNGQAMLDQFNAFDRFLDKNDFRSAFKDVDALCLSFGAVSHYYQGRMIENMYISNNIDGWATNGWEGTKVENHSGVVDLYRNHKADPSIIAYYNQDLYVAVKARRKVLSAGSKTTADFFIVNKKNLKGSYKLKVYVENNGIKSQEKTFNVKISGGVIYGELLKEAIDFIIDGEGHSQIKAELYKSNKTVATGVDEVFATKLKGVKNPIFVADTSGTMQKVLSKANISFKETNIRAIAAQKGTLVVGGELQPGIQQGNFRQDDALIDWVIRGGTLVVIDNAEEWCHYFEDKEVLDFRGSRILDRNWFGGNFFVKNTPLFEGLPQATAFNWEYQAFAAYSRHREGLRIENSEIVVGCYADHKAEVYSALSVVPVGKGRIIISTLDFKQAAGNAVANKLLENILK